MFGSSGDGPGDGGGRAWWAPAIALCIWAGAWAGTSGNVWLAGGAALIAVVTVGVAQWRRCGLLLSCGAALLVAVAVAGVRVWFAGAGPVAALAREGAVVTLEAKVGGGRLTDSGPGGPVWSADGFLRGIEGRGDSWVSGATVRLVASGALTDGWAAVPAGSTVRAVARLGAPSADEPVSAWARLRSPPQPVSPPGPLDEGVNAVRAGLRQSVAGLPYGPRALVPALVVGDTGGMSAGLQADFRATGLTHLTAVSGANLTLMLAAILWLAARLGVTGWWRRGVSVAGVVAFVLLCRAEPSVLRAAAMGVVGLAALGLGSRGQGVRFLSWAVVGLVLADPWMCRSTGFVLSVCASAGILLWAGRWADGLSTWLPRWLAEAFTVPLAAQLITQPIVTAISGQVSLAGLLANLVAAPLVGPATVLGFAAAGLSAVFPPFAVAVGWLAGGFAQGLCWVAEAGSALPGAVLTWPGGSPGLWVLASACVLALAAMPLLWRRPRLVLLLAVLMVVALLRPVAVPGWPPLAWQMVSCDVGQGDATVIAAGEGRAIVVDTGPEPAAIDRCLDQLGITEVAWLVLTHLHADHVGGVSGVASGRKVDNLLFSGITEPPGGWQQVRAALPGVAPTVAVPGLVVSAGPVLLSVLAVRPSVATGAAGEDSADQNDSSVVMRVTSGQLRVLLCGDLEEAGQGNALGTVPDLAAAVLLVPHHGSAHQLPEFLDAVGESVALVSVGKDNDYGHPAARTVGTVTSSGARVFRTDLNGSIALAIVDGGLLVTTQRSG